MKTHALLITLFFGLSVADTALAEELFVNIPRSSIKAAEFPPSANAPQSRSQKWVEFGVSSWVPRDLSLPSRITQTTPFERAGVPSLYLHLLSPMNTSQSLKIRLGLNVLTLTRSGTIHVGGAAASNDQIVYLLSPRLGLEFCPATWVNRTIAPYGGVSLLPTFAMTGSSGFDSGSLYFGVPLEMSVGARGLLSQTLGLDLGITQTVGSVHQSSVAGFGARGGVRVLL